MVFVLEIMNTTGVCLNDIAYNIYQTNCSDIWKYLGIFCNYNDAVTFIKQNYS